MISNEQIERLHGVVLAVRNLHAQCGQLLAFAESSWTVVDQISSHGVLDAVDGGALELKFAQDYRALWQTMMVALSVTWNGEITP